MDDKHSGQPQFGVVDAIDELALNLSPAQLRRLIEQSEVIASMSSALFLERHTKLELQEKINKLPEIIKQKEAKLSIKKLTKGIDQAIMQYNGMLGALLTDFMPGQPLREKIKAIENGIQKQSPKRQLNS
jgi:hypothetical protein